MGTRSEHPPGTFSWVDLTTPDADGAKRFYGALFGWEHEENEVPGGGTYTICGLGGESVAAIFASTDPRPPHWNSYVTVADADEAAAEAERLGATLIEQPFEIAEAGRMALLSDPTGAGLCIWEPGEIIGAGRVNDAGCLTWNELHTPDPARALEFYTGLFGWNSEEMDTQGGPSYTIVKVGERSNGGVMESQPGEPPNWLPYFTVQSRDQAADEAKRLGARELVRIEVPAGRIAVLADPQGAPFGISDAEPDD